MSVTVMGGRGLLLVSVDEELDEAGAVDTDTFRVPAEALGSAKERKKEP